MVITINNGNLVCKWLETRAARTVPTYNFPSILRGIGSREILAGPPSSTHSLLHFFTLWLQSATLKCLESTFARAHANWFYLNSKSRERDKMDDYRQRWITSCGKSYRVFNGHGRLAGRDGNYWKRLGQKDANDVCKVMGAIKEFAYSRYKWSLPMEITGYLHRLTTKYCVQRYLRYIHGNNICAFKFYGMNDFPVGYADGS